MNTNKKFGLPGLTILAAITLLVAMPSNAAFNTLLYGPASVTNNVAVGSSTNLQGAVTNNAMFGVVVANTTNVYNLSLMQNSQANTNAWPAATVLPGSGYPGTIYGPFRNMSVYYSFPLTAATKDLTSKVVTVRWAGSVNGSLWVSNVFNQVWTVASNSTVAVSPVLTNYDTVGFPYLAIQEIGNDTSTAITNGVIEAFGKAGL